MSNSRVFRIVHSSPLLIAVSLLALVYETSAVTPYNRYVIKSRQLQLDEGLITLRRFLLPSLTDNDRCQRYSILLYNYYKQDSLDQFRIAEIGVASTEKTLEEYKKLIVDIQRTTLRDLFKEEIKKVSKGQLDPSLLELVDCFAKKFGTNDVLATRFLNNQELRRTLSQYKSILGQKLDFLLDENAKHPTLTLEQLDPSVRETVTELFNGDQARADSRFIPGKKQENEPVLLPEIVTAEPVPVVPTPAPAPAPIPRNLPQEVVVEPASLPVVTPAPVLAYPAPAHLVPASPVPAPPVPSAPVPPTVQNSGHITDHFPEENRILLNKAISLLDLLYKTLPIESKLNDRCRAYSQVITSEPAYLNEQLAQRIVKETSLKIKTKGSSVDKYIPEANVRDNFLFTISAFPKESVGDETWMDLVDCVSQWETIDEQVRAFMNNPQHYYEELLASSNKS